MCGALWAKMIKKSLLEGIEEGNIILYISSEPGGGQTSDPLRATIHLPQKLNNKFSSLDMGCSKCD